ncbi:acyl-CoA dehydrogenase family protein [Streptomyces sp. JJ38]|uniref:acyl-CoA dehydrogenase family protein n=1 Tax=Streptomyces sp. JJ38 TaxID=2738128 RepID=UPI001C5A38B4|nr:acyl-CoA dehydrogenase family protein [Streptomyces sp. JJ38]MBW1598378.1 acyl-CoA dehydrogenase family protein [Streptomyces sp. JJ38]
MLSGSLRDRYAREHAPFAESFASFVRRELVPLESETCDSMRDEPPASVAAMVRRRSAELGFYACDYPAEYGGQSAPLAAKALLYERAEASGCRLAPVALCQAEGPSELLLHGTAEQKERYLRPLIAGETTRCLAMTEPEGGSNMLRPATRARRRGAGGWSLSGRKTFVSNAADARIALVLASVAVADGEERTGVFIVRTDTPGFVVGHRYEGMADGAVYDVILDDVQLDEGALLGGSDGWAEAGFLTSRMLAKGRLMVAATANGIAQQALAAGLEFAKTRQTFGGTIGAHQHVQQHLVRGQAMLEAARLLTHSATQAFDEGADVVAEAAQAKWIATENAVRTVNDVFQVHGGTAWVRGHPLEYLYRRVRAYTIVEGTTEIQKVIVANSLGLG